MGKYSKPFSVFIAILGAFMVFVYAGVGVIFLFFPDIVDVLKGTPRILLGILLILYSFYRIYRIYQTWKEGNEEK
jgi:amino acid permease